MFSTVTAEIRETDFSDIIMAAEHAQAQLNFFAAFTVALFEVPLPFIAPAETDRAVWHGHFAVIIKGNGFPFWILFLAQTVNEV
ncbi:hypothetical protein D3C81_2132520 [compost metagenome]